VNFFTHAVLQWARVFGRVDLPWQEMPITAYHVFVSEIMLQQTQVATVIPYYRRFLAAFPTVQAIPEHSLDYLLQYWSGLGFYQRARNLYKTAGIISTTYQGVFPNTVKGLRALPGIGRSTAGAICALAYDEPATILEGNVKRVLIRFYGLELSTQASKALWALADRHSPTPTQGSARAYTQAIMDIGALVCLPRNPHCSLCPLNTECIAYKTQRQHILPLKLPKKILPHKHTYMVLMVHNGKVLMTRRMDSGLWGGLWTFPELPSDDIAAYTLQKCGKIIKVSTQLATFSHVFSHFRLRITPLMVALDTLPLPVNDQSILWYTPKQGLPGGIPTPIRKLLDQLINQGLLYD
jgi:A/G-specific adenine glycosylase